MTIYAGEYVQIVDSPKNVDQKTVLTNTDGVETITIWDIDGITVLVDEAVMTYLTAQKQWVYNWASPNVAGAYLARLTFTGGGLPSWEYKTIRLRKDKAPV